MGHGGRIGWDGTLFPKIEWALLRLSRYIEGTIELSWPCMLDDARDMIASIRKEKGQTSQSFWT